MLKAILKEQRWLDQTTNFIHPEIVKCRANHVLAEIYNASLCTLLFHSLVACGATQIISAVTLIVQSSSDGVPLLANMFFAFIIPQAFLVFIIVFGIGGEFHNTSNISLKRLMQGVLTTSSLTRQDRRYLQRYLTSCQVGKIKLGFSNFIEKTTPPILQLFCVNRIIDLILVR